MILSSSPPHTHISIRLSSTYAVALPLHGLLPNPSDLSNPNAHPTHLLDNLSSGNPKSHSSSLGGGTYAGGAEVEATRSWVVTGRGGICTPCLPTHLQSKRTYPASLRQNNSRSKRRFRGCLFPLRTKTSHPSQSHAPGPYFLLTAEVGGVGAMRELPPGSGCWSPLSEEVESRNGNSPPPPLAGPSPPPPRRLFTSSLNFICATLAGMRTLKKKKKTLALNPAAAPEEPCGIKPPQRGKKCS